MGSGLPGKKGEPIVHIKNLNKWFGDHQVLSDVELVIHRGEVVVIIGPSGSGKSTLLRCINFLEPFQTGEIAILDEVLRGTREQSPAEAKMLKTQLRKLRPRVGMVFQRLNLFPHLTVLENITVGPTTVKGVSEVEAKAQAMAVLERVGLVEKATSRPRELSGGQQQRVAIARTLVMRSELVLLDEVTSALDPELIGEVLKFMKELAEQGQTMVVVTHEMEFAKDIAASVVMMDQGRIIERGPPSRIFTNPESPRTQRFLSQVIQKHRAGTEASSPMGNP
jgi:ABC-type polar amino acid transport system ATPase subunit